MVFQFRKKKVLYCRFKACNLDDGIRFRTMRVQTNIYTIGPKHQIINHACTHKRAHGAEGCDTTFSKILITSKS